MSFSSALPVAVVQTRLKILTMSSPDFAFKSSSLRVLSQAALSFMLATPAVISNVLLLVTVFRDPGRNRTSPVTLLVVNLAVCDLLAGAVSGYGGLYYNIALLTGQTREELFGFLLVLFIPAIATNVVSSCTIAAMSFDRLLAVSLPHGYKALVTEGKIKVFIAVSWIYSLLFSSLRVMGISQTLFVALYCHIHMTVPLIILPVVYWKTYRVLRLHNNQVRNLANGRERMEFACRNTERKVVSAFLLVLVSFYLVFAPQYIAQNIHLFCPSLAKRSSFKMFLRVSNQIILVNCSLNPFIYAWRIPKYKRAFMAFCDRCACRSRIAVGDGPEQMEMQRPAT